MNPARNVTARFVGGSLDGKEMQVVGGRWVISPDGDSSDCYERSGDVVGWRCTYSLKERRRR